MEWLQYLLEANGYLIILYIFYRLLLHKETFYRLNRWYLLAAVCLAFVIPLLQAQTLPAAVQSVIVPGYPSPAPENAIFASGKVDVVFLIPILYCLACAWFIIRFVAETGRIVSLYYRLPKYKQEGVMHIALEKEQEVFSFFNWLFYHPACGSEKAIITHELVHIRQKHSIDIVLFELVQAVSWFNPFIHLMKRDLKFNHECLADRQASLEMPSAHAYALLLIDHSLAAGSRPAIAHQMAAARQLKQRISRLGDNRSSKPALIRYLLAVPLIAGLTVLSAFCVKKRIRVDTRCLRCRVRFRFR